MRADDIISNESDLEALAKAILAQHHVYCAMAEKARGKQSLRRKNETELERAY